MTKQVDGNDYRTDGEQSPENADSQNAPRSLPPGPRVDIQVEDTGAVLCYANFCRVTGTPEELILDFGLNPQPVGATKIEIKQRLVINFFTAKRLLQALGLSIGRHESAFGVLETDVQKRITPAPRRAASPS